MNENAAGDITVGMKLVKDQFLSDIATVRKAMNATMGGMTVSGDVFGLGTRSKLMEEAFQNMGNSVMGAQKNVQQFFDNYYGGMAGAVKITNMGTNEIRQALNKNIQAPFDGAAMSMMFFGMAIQGAMRSVWSSSQKVFQDIMHSVEGTVTSFDKLNNSLAYLGFTVGEALAPIADFLAPIIEDVATWVQEHEGLVRVLFSVLSVIGSILFVWGFLKLGVLGVITKVGELIGWLKITWVWMQGLLTSTNGLLGSFTLLNALKLTGIIAGIIGMLFYIYKLQEVMGGWGEFFKSVGRGLLRVTSIMGAAIAGVFTEVWNLLKLGWNGFLMVVEDGINDVINMINSLASVVNAASRKLGLGDVFGKIKNVDFSKAEADVKGFGESFSDTFGAIMEKYVAFEQKVLAPSKGYAEFGGFLPSYPAGSMAAVEAKVTTQTQAATENNQSTVQYNNITIDGTGMDLQAVLAEAERLANVSYRRTY